MDHIDNMEQLKQGIRLRAYGQRDPVVEYRLEGFDMFDEMIAMIREDTSRAMLVAPKRYVKIMEKQAELARLREEAAKKAAAAHQVVINQEQPKPVTVPAAVQASLKREQVAKPTATSGDGTDTSRKTVVKGKKVGRNDPCPCGSGKKYKKCCGKDL